MTHYQKYKISNTSPDAATCGVSHSDYSKVVLAHGGGGLLSHKLVDEVFYPAFSNKWLAQQHDGAIFPVDKGRLAYTTDSFVVDPIFFPGGNIGDLAVNGTVNDLASCGARPTYLTAGFIIEEGFSIADLKKVVESMAAAALKAGVAIVSGDTKVVGHGKCDKIYINTSGVGVVPSCVHIDPSSASVGDVVICSGRIAEHGVCILSTRESLGFETRISSDTVSLNRMVGDLLSQVNGIKILRDPTRGGLSSTLNEISECSDIQIEISEQNIPISDEVVSACDLLGLDPLCIANEGLMLVVLPEKQAERALQVMHRHPEGVNAAVIGTVVASGSPLVTLKTEYGGARIVEMLVGDQLPRIC